MVCDCEGALAFSRATSARSSSGVPFSAGAAAPTSARCRYSAAPAPTSAPSTAGRTTRTSAFDVGIAPSFLTQSSAVYSTAPHIMRRSALLFIVAAMLAASCGGRAPASRLSRIRQRGFLVCGVFPGIAGFAQVDRNGRYSGFDIDMCRAVAAAVVGSADRIRYEPVATLDLLQGSSDIDLVSRRLTWSLQREGMGVLV